MLYVQQYFCTHLLNKGLILLNIIYKLIIESKQNVCYDDVYPKQLYLHNIAVSKGKVQLHPKLV